MSLISVISPLFWWFVFCILLILLVFLVTKLITGITFGWIQHRMKQDKTLISEYSVPKELSPSEIGYILDRKFGEPELAACIIMLAQKKAISLQATPDGVMIKYIFNKHYQGKDWLELELLGHIASLPQKSITWSSLVKELGLYSSFQKGMERQIKKQLVADGFLFEDKTTHADLIRKKLRNSIGLILSITFVLLPLYQTIGRSILNPSNGYKSIDNEIILFYSLILAFFLWPFWNGLVDLFIRIYMKGSGIPAGATKKLFDNWRTICGFRIYLSVVEAERLSLNPSVHNDFAAWCLAVGVGPNLENLVLKNSVDK